MPKAPRAKESATPKKRSRKANPEDASAVQAESVSNTAAVQLGAPPSPETETGTATPNPKAAPENGNGHGESGTNGIVEKIRQRAYELYLQRGGRGGSPEQDWLRAQQEICGQQTA